MNGRVGIFRNGKVSFVALHALKAIENSLTDQEVQRGHDSHHDTLQGQNNVVVDGQVRVLSLSRATRDPSDIVPVHRVVSIQDDDGRRQNGGKKHRGRHTAILMYLGHLPSERNANFLVPLDGNNEQQKKGANDGDRSAEKQQLAQHATGKHHRK